MVGRSVKDQLLSSYYWAIVFLLCVYMTRINYFIQTVFQQMAFYLEDPVLADEIATSFTVLLPLGGVIGIPIIGWILDKKGVGFAAIILFFMGISYGVLGMLPSAQPQLISLCIFVILRPLMYTFTGDYTGKAFGYEHFGTVYGLLNCIAGLFSLVLRPIDVLTKNTLHGNYTIPNVLGVALGAISTIITIWRIYYRCDSSAVP